MESRVSPDQIEELRKRLGLSRRELAAQLGVAKRTVERWEQGRGEPNPTAEKILQELDD